MRAENAELRFDEEFDPINGLEFEKILVTPELAKEILEANVNNRPLSKFTVDALAKRMTIGQWSYNGAPIKFSTEGKLLDGQHRLKAICKSRKIIEMLVVRRLKQNVFSTIDDGKKRSPADTLFILGEKNCAALATCLRLIHEYTLNKDIKRKLRFTNTDFLNLLELYPDAREAANHARKISYNFSPMRTSVASLCVYLFSSLSSKDSKLFFESLITGENLPSGSPIRLLRDKLLSEYGNKFSDINTPKMCALTIKVWNAWRSGFKIKSLRFGMNDVFPTPV